MSVENTLGAPLNTCDTADPDWTKQQTDELLELADRFDTRFIVMADRVESGKSCEVATAALQCRDAVGCRRSRRATMGFNGNCSKSAQSIQTKSLQRCL